MSVATVTYRKEIVCQVNETIRAVIQPSGITTNFIYLCYQYVSAQSQVSLFELY